MWHTAAWSDPPLKPNFSFRMHPGSSPPSAIASCAVWLGGCALDPGDTDSERNDRPVVATLLSMLRLRLSNQRARDGMTGVFGGCAGRRNHDSMLLSPRRHTTKVGRYVVHLVGVCTAQRPPTDDDVLSEEPSVAGSIANPRTWSVREGGSLS